MDISGEAEVGGGVGGIILLTIEKGINKYIKKNTEQVGKNDNSVPSNEG